MQCKCGGVAEYEINTFQYKNRNECEKFSFPLKPERYPVNVKRAQCKSCKRSSVSFSYVCDGVVMKEGEILKPDGSKKTQKPTTTAKRLW